MFSPRLTLSIGLAALALTAGATTASAETIEISDGTVVTEGAAGDVVKATFIVTRHRKVGEADQGGFSLATSDGTAIADSDYVISEAASGTAGKNPCQSALGCTDSETFEVPIVGDDVPEPEENFYVNLRSSTMIVTDGQGEATILDDDGFVAAPARPAAPAAPAFTAAPATTAAPMTVATTNAAAQAPARAAAEEDVVGPAMGMVFRGLRGNIAKVRVQCPKDEIRCVGRLAVQLNEKTMASAPFRLRGGQTKLLRIRLKSKQRRTLHDAGVVYLKASAFDAAGNRAARVLSFQL